jgi:hypothetical protein
MPVIINPFQGQQDPTAQAFADVGKSIFGDTGAGELRRQQILAAQRTNTETTNLGDRIRALGGVQNAGADPTAQAETIESGYSPGDFGKLGLMGSAIANGAAAQPTQNWQVGTGQSYDNTANAVNAKLAENARQFNMTPVDAVQNGQPAFGTRASVVAPGSTFAPPQTDSQVKGNELYQNFGRLGDLPPAEQNVLGASNGAGPTTYRPATPEDLKAAGISSTDPAVYQMGSNGKLEPVSGAQGPGMDLPTVPLGPDGRPDPVQQAAFLKSIGNPGLAAVVQGVLNYQLDPNKINTYRGNEKAQLFQLVTQADPTFDMTQYQARVAMKKSVTSGPLALNIISGNTTVQHAVDLVGKVDALGNGGFTPGNMVRNGFNSLTGNPNITNFNQNKEALVGEVTKIFKGTGATDVQSLEGWRAQMDAANSPEQLKGALVDLMTNLLPARLQTVDSQYQAVMGHPPDFQFLTPATKNALKGLGIDPEQVAASIRSDNAWGSPAPAGAQQQPGSQPASPGGAPAAASAQPAPAQPKANTTSTGVKWSVN